MCILERYRTCPCGAPNETVLWLRLFLKLMLQPRIGSIPLPGRQRMECCFDCASHFCVKPRVNGVSKDHNAVGFGYVTQKVLLQLEIPLTLWLAFCGRVIFGVRGFANEKLIQVHCRPNGLQLRFPVNLQGCRNDRARL